MKTKLAIMLLVAAVSVATAQEKKKAPAKKVEMTTTSSGLKYAEVVVGKGAEAKEGDAVEVRYRGTFPTGKVFDPGTKPFTFSIGKGGAIQCWQEGIKGMKVGGKRKLVCPPDLAYGKRGYPGVIPPDSTLHFDVELLKVK
jgi:peptidylprolyl isomerase